MSEEGPNEKGDFLAGTIQQSELNRLLEQLHELRQTLLPFARFAAALPPVIDGQHRLTDDGVALSCKKMSDPTGSEAVVTFADFRRAKYVIDLLEEADHKRLLSRFEEKLSEPVGQDRTVVDFLREMYGSKRNR